MLTEMMAVLGVLAAVPTASTTTNLSVNCDTGGSVNRALAKLDHARAATLYVHGTCNENVDVHHFQQLTLRGLNGAVIAGQVSGTRPPLTVRESVTVIVRDLTVRNGSLFEACSDCLLMGVTVEGTTYVWGGGRVQLHDVRLDAHGSWTALGVWDAVTVRMANCTVEPGGSSLIGITAGQNATVAIASTSIRGFYFGISAGTGAHVGLRDNTGTRPGTDPTVWIEDNTCLGMEIGGTATADLFGVARVRRNGSACHWAGIVVGGNAVLSTNNIEGVPEISQNFGPAILVQQNGHAGIDGANVIDGAGGGIEVRHNGSVTLSNSTISNNAGWGVSAQLLSSVGVTGTTTVTGNAAGDIACDTHSLVSGSSQVQGATSISCTNYLP